MKFSFRAEFPRLFSVTVSKAGVRRCAIKKVFLKISQNSQENTCARVSFSIKLQFSRVIEMQKSKGKTQIYEQKQRFERSSPLPQMSKL